MTDFDLEKDDPKALAASDLDLTEVLEAVVRLPELSERTAEVLDFLHRQRALDALAGRPDPDELHDLVRYFDRLLVPERARPLNSLAKPYATRWEAFGDLLDERLRRLETTEGSKLQDFLARDHVRPILEFLARSEREGRVVSQADIGEALRLRKANLTRVLNLLAARDLVVRRRKGRTNEVSLGEAAREELEALDPVPTFPRGIASLVPRRSHTLKPCG